jgi:hypothetical protein
MGCALALSRVLATLRMKHSIEKSPGPAQCVNKQLLRGTTDNIRNFVYLRLINCDSNALQTPIGAGREHKPEPVLWWTPRLERMQAAGTGLKSQ